MFPLISEKAVEEAVRNCEQLKRREQEEDNVTIEELEKQRVEALEVVEKEREIVEQERAVYDSKTSVRAGHTILCTNTVSLTEQLKRDLHDAMYTFNIEYTQITTDLQTDTFNNLCRQEQMGEKIWHLEKRVMEFTLQLLSHPIFLSIH